MTPDFAVPRHALQNWSLAWIVAGLLLLAAAILWPGAPAVTGMALVMLGATGSLLARFAGRPEKWPLFVVHAVVYGGLYGLFVGAVFHAAAQSGAGLTPSAMLDLAASVGPAATSLGLLFSALSDGVTNR